MNAQAWITLTVGMIGILSGVLGQAIYWAKFQGRIVTRVEGHDGEIADLKRSRSDMWGHINELGNRMTAVETSCDIRHSIERHR